MQLNEILQRLESARIIAVNGDKYELAHDTLARRIADKRSAEEKALIEWEMLIRNKLSAGKQSGAADYLTSGQLAGIQPLEAKLNLNVEEQKFLQASKLFRKAEENKKKKRAAILLFSISSVAIIISLLMLWAMIQKGVADKELARNRRILDNMYFYAGRFALVVKKDSSGQFLYGYMDKEGNIRISYDYTEAAPFDEYGYARVKILEKLYLIDTFNNRYPLAESPKAINDSTLAVSLKEQWLDELPVELLKNKQIKILYLRGNRLENLDHRLSDLSDLMILDIGYNKLTEIPLSLSYLKNLKVLDLRNNRIDTLGIGNINPHNLEILNLSFNNIKNIPDEIEKLKALTILDLSNNKITKLPDQLSKLTKLKQLNVYGNQVKFIPNSLANMNLDFFNVGGNQLSKEELKKIYRVPIAKNENNNKLNNNTENYKNNNQLSDYDTTSFENDVTIEESDVEEICSKYLNSSSLLKKIAASYVISFVKTPTFEYSIQLNYNDSKKAGEKLLVRLTLLETNNSNEFFGDIKFVASDSSELEFKVDRSSTIEGGKLQLEMFPKSQNAVDWLKSKKLSSFKITYRVGGDRSKTMFRPVYQKNQIYLSEALNCILGSIGIGTDACSKLYKESDKENFVTKYFELCNSEHFDFKLSFIKKDDKLFVKFKTNKTDLGPNAKIVFVAKVPVNEYKNKEEKRSFVFQKIKSEANFTEYSSNVPVSAEIMNWILAQSDYINSVYIENIDNNKSYSYSLNNGKSGLINNLFCITDKSKMLK